MKKTVSYSPTKTYLIAIKGEPKYLYLFFEYIQNSETRWWLTSKVERIKLLAKNTVITTMNSQYTLATADFIYKNLSMKEFLYCKNGINPNEVAMMTAMKKVMNPPSTYSIN